MPCAALQSSVTYQIHASTCAPSALCLQFSAESITIVVAEIIMFGIALKKTHRLRDAYLVLLIYPLSIALVAILELPSIGLN